MDQRHESEFSLEERRQKGLAILGKALLASLVVHVAIFLMWKSPRIHDSPFAAAGERAGDVRAAAGGMQAITVVSPPTRPIIPPPIPLPSVDVEPVEFDDQAQLDEAATQGERPGVEGPGTETGDGEGDGGTADEGLFQMVPATPRSMIIPPSDDDLRGKAFEVWLFVDERGRVVADSTYLRPPTGNGGLDRRLLREASEWIFNPARRGGQTIAAWTTYRFQVGGE